MPLPVRAAGKELIDTALPAAPASDEVLTPPTAVATAAAAPTPLDGSDRLVSKSHCTSSTSGDGVGGAVALGVLLPDALGVTDALALADGVAGGVADADEPAEALLEGVMEGVAALEALVLTETELVAVADDDVVAEGDGVTEGVRDGEGGSAGRPSSCRLSMRIVPVAPKLPPAPT